MLQCPVKFALYFIIYVDVAAYSHLAYQVKLGLKATRKGSPEVRIEVPMDEVMFQHLAACGIQRPQHIRGQPVYQIAQYSSLNAILGEKWYVRTFKGGDFCYCHRESVKYYLHKRKDVEEVDDDGIRVTEGGYILVFKFVRMDGVCHEYHRVCSIP